MKITLRLSFLILIISCCILNAEDVKKIADEISSRIESVIIYPEHALIQRVGRVELSAGANRIVLKGLSAAIIPETIQVSGEGSQLVKILDVSAVTRFVSEEANERVALLNEQLLVLKDQENEYTDRSQQLNASLVFINRIRDFETSHPAESGESLKRDIEEWRSMMGFYDEELASLLAGQRELKQLNRELKKEIKRVSDELNYVDNESAFETKELFINLEAEENTNFNLEVSYLVSDANWTPLYDVRVALAGELQLVVKAAVQQSTSLDWNDVNVTLSTARPAVNSNIPSLRTWRLSKMELSTGGLRNVGSAISVYTEEFLDDVGATDSNRLLAYASNTEVGGTLAQYSGETEKSRLAEFLDSQESSSLSSTEFKLPYRLDLPSNSDPQKVTINTLDSECTIYHFSMAKVSDTTYLKARAVNRASFPLLPGPTQVYLDGKYVATSEIPYLKPGEEMNFLLGASSRMNVERELINKFNEAKGFSGKNKKVTYEYRYTIENYDDKEQALVLRDNIPVSGNEEIIVKLLEPKAASIEVDDLGMIIWRLNLAAGEKREITLKFTVQYPKDWIVHGL